MPASIPQKQNISMAVVTTNIHIKSHRGFGYQYHKVMSMQVCMYIHRRTKSFAPRLLDPMLAYIPPGTLRLS